MNAAVTVGGVVVPYDSSSNDIGFVESFAAYAFRDQELDGWGPVMADVYHDGTQLVGSTWASTLRLDNTSSGLAYEVDLPVAAAIIAELVDRGDLAEASVQFQCITDQWSASADGMPMRNVLAARLVAVSIVPRGAYPATSARIVRGRGLLHAALAGSPTDNGIAPAFGRSSRKRSLDTSTLSVREAARQVRVRQNLLARDERHRALMAEADLWIDLGRRR